MREVLDIIKDKGYKKIALQFPEGLKEKAIELAETIESKTNTLVFISSDPCYGACDLADREMKDLGVEALFHFGHSPIIKKPDIPTYYIDINIDFDVISLFDENLDLLPKKIGLITTIQHLHLLKKVKEFLEYRDFEVFIGKPLKRAMYEGQVLGCDFSSARAIASLVDCFAFIGSGDFHAIGVALATKKRVLVFDITREVRDVQQKVEKILKQRYAIIARAMEADSFGILIGEKKGQQRLSLALKIKEKIVKNGKKAFLLTIREITPENLYYIGIDAFVNTACPRVAIDDIAKFKKPMLNPKELEILLGERKWEEYEMEELL